MHSSTLRFERHIFIGKMVMTKREFAMAEAYGIIVEQLVPTAVRLCKLSDDVWIGYWSGLERYHPCVFSSRTGK